MNPSVDPFDENKYRALMDGNECSEIMYSHVVSTTTLRFDSEYYKKEYLEIEKYISNHLSCFSSLSEYNLIPDASAFYPALEPYYNTGSIPFIRVADVKDEIDYDGCIRIPQMGEEFSTLKKCHKGDIVLTKGGRVGTAGLLSEDSYVTRDLIFINSSLLERKDYVSLYMYFCTQFAQKQMLRSSSMTAQPHLTITLIKNILLYRFSDLFKKDIMLLYDRHEELLKEALSQIKKAEGILSSQLKMTGKPESSIAIKEYSNSFIISGRLDAEYYQPKYDKYWEDICSYPDGYTLIKDEFDPVLDKCSLDEQAYAYVEIGDVNVNTGTASFNVIETDSLPANAKIMTQKGDIIVSTVRPNRGAVAILENDDLLVSGAFTVLRQKNDYKKEVLQVLLRTSIYRDWLLRYNVGTSYPVIKDEDVLNMPIPLFNQTIKDAVESRVQESFALRRKSKTLLEYAKQAVEMAIEQGEKAALEWLNNRVNV